MEQITMTRQHFELIAKTIREAKQEYLKEIEQYGVVERDVFDSLCEKFAEKLVETNPRFDVKNFLNACIVKTNEV